jgi:hypothetical protein
MVFCASPAGALLFKNLQVICVGTRVNVSFGCKNRVTICPAMGQWKLYLVRAQNLQLKSLILAQIERWRRA